MVYALEINNRVDKAFKKIEKRDRNQLLKIRKKLLQILENPYHFNLSEMTCVVLEEFI